MNSTGRIYYIKKVFDSRGTLCVTNLNDPALPFVPRRAFWITDVPQGAQRGGHAHKTCDELLFVLSGAFTLSVYDGKERETMHMKAEPERGVMIHAGEWCELTDFAVGTVILVLASEEYNAQGYIHALDNFEKWHIIRTFAN